MYGYLNQIKITNRIDHLAKQLKEDAIQEALDCDLVLESVTLEDLENTYLFGFDVAQNMMLEAFKSKASMLEHRVKKFANQVGTQLSTITVEGVEVGKPRKSGAVAVQMAKIALSDGQSLSIAFHAPDNDPLKVNPDDTMIAFRFLLNSRDITHAVAPKGSQDISLKEATSKLAQLAEANTDKFQSNKANKDAQAKELADAQAKAAELEEQAAQIGLEADKLADSLQQATKREIILQKQIDKQNEIQEELRKQLAKKQGATVGAGAGAGEDSTNFTEQDLNNLGDSYDFSVTDSPENAIKGINKFANQFGIAVNISSGKSFDGGGESVAHAKLSKDNQTAIIQVLDSGSMGVFSEDGSRVSKFGKYQIFDGNFRDSQTLNRAMQSFAANVTDIADGNDEDNSLSAELRKASDFWYKKGKWATVYSPENGFETDHHLTQQEANQRAKELAAENPQNEYKVISELLVDGKTREYFIQKKRRSDWQEPTTDEGTNDQATDGKDGNKNVSFVSFNEGELQANLTGQDQVIVEKLRANGYQVVFDAKSGYTVVTPNGSIKTMGSSYPSFKEYIDYLSEKLSAENAVKANATKPQKQYDNYHELTDGAYGKPTRNSLNKLKPVDLESGDDYIIEYGDHNHIRINKTGKEIKATWVVGGGLMVVEETYPSLTQLKHFGTQKMDQFGGKVTQRLFANDFTQDELDRAMNGGADVVAIAPNEQARSTVVDSELFWYGLRARPYGMNTTPNDATVQKALNEEEAKAMFPKAGDNVRHGAVGYAEKLTSNQVSEWELVDLSKIGSFQFDEDYAEMIVRQTLLDWMDSKEVAAIAQSDFYNLRQKVELGTFKEAFASLLRKQPEYIDRKQDVDEYKEWTSTIDQIDANFLAKVAEEMGVIEADKVVSDDADEAVKGKTEDEKALLALNPSEFNGIEKSFNDEKQITSDVRSFVGKLLKDGKLPKGVTVSATKGKASTLYSINLKLTGLPDSIKLHTDEYLQHMIDNPTAPLMGITRYTEEVNNLLEYISAYAGQYDKVTEDPYGDYGNQHSVYGTRMTVDWSFADAREIEELASFTETHQQGVESDKQELDVNGIRDSLDADTKLMLEQLEDFTNFEVKLGKQEITLPNGKVESVNIKDESAVSVRIFDAHKTLTSALNDKADTELKQLEKWSSKNTYFDATGEESVIEAAWGIQINDEMRKIDDAYSNRHVPIFHDRGECNVVPILKGGKYLFAVYDGRQLIGEASSVSEVEALAVKSMGLSTEPPTQEQPQGDSMEIQHVQKLEAIRDYNGEVSYDILAQYQTELEQAVAYFTEQGNYAENEALVEVAFANYIELQSKAK